MKKGFAFAKSLIDLAPKMIRLVKSEISSAAEGTISHPQFRILSNLSRGANSVSQLARDQGVSQPAMSKMIDLMVEKELVRRSNASVDRRQTHLEITKKGIALYLQLKKKAAKKMQGKFSNLSQHEINLAIRSAAHLDHLVGAILAVDKVKKEKK